MINKLLGSTGIFYFDTYNSSGNSVAPTAITTANIQVIKNGSSVRGSVSGYSVTQNAFSKNGSHILLIDFSDNADSGFYEAGAEYSVRVIDLTVDGVTPVHAWVKNGQFRLSLKPNVDNLQDVSAEQVSIACGDAISDYDPPTNTEMEARTLASSEYFNPSVTGVSVLESSDKNGYALSETAIGQIIAALNLETYDGSETFSDIMGMIVGLATGNIVITNADDADGSKTMVLQNRSGTAIATFLSPNGGSAAGSRTRS